MNKKSPLDTLYIATPCPAKWEDMTGDDKVRACALCQKNVYNISNMTRSEAEELLSENDSSLCVGYYRREDGTIITDDCPVGLKQIRNSWRFVKKVAAGLLGLLLSSNLLQGPVAIAADRWKSNLAAKGARFGTGANVWRVPLTPKELKTKEGSNSIEQAVYKSEVIVIAEFKGIKEEPDFTFFSKPTATYNVIRAMKGKLPSKEVSIKYAFHDESALMSPKNWKYSKSILPKAGDVFILCLIQQDEKGLWYTYNGSFGRFEFKPMNLNMISLEHQRQSRFRMPPRPLKTPKHCVPQGAAPKVYGDIKQKLKSAQPHQPIHSKQQDP